MIVNNVQFMLVSLGAYSSIKWFVTCERIMIKMNIKKINNCMAYAHFIIGAVKIIYIIFVFLKFSTNISAIFSGGIVDNNYFTEISTAIGIAELILGIISIIMIIININKQPEVISGYLLGLGAIAIELLLPASLFIFEVFAQCGMYMRAGIKIKNAIGEYKDTSANRKIAKNTEWFYNEHNNISNEITENEMQKIMDKLQPEILEWKKLLETGMIDEETYNKEINKMISKEKKKIIKSKRW